MALDRRQQAKEILQTTAALSDDQRTAFLKERCQGDAALHTEVQALLRLHERARPLLATVSTETPTLVMENSQPFSDANFGKRIGAYEIIRQLGQGGMGAVYEALRADEQYDKRVAIKLIKRGMDSDFVIQRFRQERQILASLDHPNIARLLDGGATEEGLPYFVMEYIEGQSLTDYCDTHNLTTGERLKLFQQLCSAIQYAHQNLVVHRDLKPGNILVTPEGEVKLLDFGIAKLLAPEFSSSETTAKYGRLLTPDYASPEQVRGEPITTASDIYSMGVVLYQLLTGQRPYRVTNTSMVRIICEQEPDKPSTVVNRSVTLAAQNEPTGKTPALDEVSKRRRAQPEKLRRQLAGDLDNIILKAMRKEPSRRYASAGQLSEDLRRHLEGLPVTARPDTFSYRAKKFMQRNKAGMAAGILLLLTLLGGIIGTTWQASVAKRERAQAEKRFNDVRKLANSFLFEFHDSIRNLPGATAARELVVKRALEYLDSLSQEAGNDFSLQRELATAYEKVGDVQGDPYSGSLGDTVSALNSYRKSLSIREQLLAVDMTHTAVRRELASSYLKVGSMNWLQGKWDDAFDNQQRAVKINEELIALDPANTELQVDLARSYTYLGDTLLEKGAIEEALANQRKALAMRQELAATSTDIMRAKELGSSFAKLGDVLWDSGKIAESFESYDKAVKVFEPLLTVYANDDDLRSRLEGTYQRLGEALRRNREPSRALEYFHKCVKLDEARVLRDPSNAVARRNLMGEYVSIGITLAESEKYQEALTSYRKALEIAAALVATDPDNQQSLSDVMKIHLNVGIVMTEAKNWAEADANLKSAMAIAEKLVAQGSGSTESKDALANISLAYGYMKINMGEAEKALESFRKALTVREALLAEAPANVDYRFRLADLWSIFGDAYETLAKQGNTPSSKRLENWQEAHSWYQRSLDSITRMRDENVLSKGRLEYIPSLSDSVARCAAAIAKLKIGDRE